VLKTNTNSFVNLSDHHLTNDETEFLNLGLNYHIQPKYDKLHKETELEVLYDSLIELNKKNTISLNPNITTQLAAESTKHRNPKYNSSIPPHLRRAAKELKQNNDVIVRKADKSSIYVILNRTEYMDKLNIILSDTSKFKRIKKDPTEVLKKEANDLITMLNAVQGDLHLQKIIGDYGPGYIYGNVKIHKPDNPLRPIISQVLTPTYQLAKTLNKIITPFIPNQYMLKSTDDFLDLLQNHNSTGIIASLDVESLFTNVPIDDTIEIIIEHTYNHPDIPPPKMPKKILKQMLELCTKKAPFRSPDGGVYLQVEGVAMGSPLGPTFANFYMGHLEQKVLSNQHLKPTLYGRYIDDIFLQVINLEQLNELKDLFQENSVLNFTYEIGINNKLPFLDVMVHSNEGEFHTTVYHKPTNHGTCLNANSECCDLYKNSVINNYLNRAFKITKNWTDFNHEVCHIKQILVNNNYSNNTIDKLINKFLDNKLKQSNSIKENNVTIPIFYHNQMHDNYKLDERVIKDIITNNTKCIDPHQKLKVIIYYKNHKTTNLIMKNNPSPKPSLLSQTNVIYQFSCPLPHSKVETYIGMTQTTLLRRLKMHAQSGSIHQHFVDEHQYKPSKDQITDNTTVIAHAENRYKLYIKEALLIMHNAPSINKQFDNFTNVLKLHTSRNNNQTRIKNVSLTNHHPLPPPLPFPHPPSSPLLPPLPIPLPPPPFKVHIPTSMKSTPGPIPLSPLTDTITSTPSPLLDDHLPVSLSLPHSILSPPPLSNPYTPPSFPPSISHEIFSFAPPSSPDQPPTNTNRFDQSHDPQFFNTFLTALPDMSMVLGKFGIDSDLLCVVPLKQYKWKNFNLNISPKHNTVSVGGPNSDTTEENFQTISQRIRSMRRLKQHDTHQPQLKY